MVSRQHFYSWAVHGSLPFQIQRIAKTLKCNMIRLEVIHSVHRGCFLFSNLLCGYIRMFSCPILSMSAGHCRMSCFALEYQGYALS